MYLWLWEHRFVMLETATRLESGRSWGKSRRLLTSWELSVGDYPSVIMVRSTALLFSVLLLQLSNSCEGNGKKEPVSSTQFTQHLYNAYIYENSAAKTYLESHVKMGIYISNPSSEFRYKIISGDHENLFKAEDYILGDFCFLRIRTKGGNSAVLNREVRDHYMLNVKAVEKKTNAEARTKVKVHVLDTNDLRPLFSPTSYSVSLPESTALRTSVARVRATDADIGTNGEFYYSFKDRTDMFAIHPTNGVITLTGKLDYSETKQYDLEILAADRGQKLYGSSGISSMAKLTIHVEQGNEHAPVISAVTLTPSETDKDPTYALITVEDEDLGINGEIASLNIVAGDPLHQFKAVRSNPGSKEYRIKAVDQVDWESQSSGYNLTLQAKDKGNPPQFSSVKVIHVMSPQSKSLPCRFEKAVYKARLNEFAPPNSPVVMVTASPMYPQIKFALKHHAAKFHINPDTGLITTNNFLKTQEAFHYELEVIIVDKQASTKVIIDVIDMNDNAPEFKQSSYKASVSENVPVGTSVLTVSATDVDSGENGYVTYSIANLNPPPFVIDYFSGEITTSKDLDYELMPRIYNLRIRASDWGSPYRREVEALVTIFLNNLNDNKPLFEKVNCIGTMPRDLNVGEQIATVSAIDADELQLVRYRILSGNELDLFDLNPNSGVLVLKRSLTDELGLQGSFYSLQITATDGENFATSMYINITVATSRKQVNLNCIETGVAKHLAEKLLQANKIHNHGDAEELFSDNHSINRHAPRFGSFPSVIEIKEDKPVGTNLLLINVTDLDNGFNGKLVHVISGGDPDSRFIVDLETGWLKVFTPLDREKTDHYTLNITVYDLGIPQRSAWRLLDVNILDANDNSPEFLQDMYFEEVSENQEVGSEIIQLEATDQDLGTNGEIKYSLLTGTDVFAIDSATGIVKVIGLLDREKDPVYLLKIEARDQAKQEPQLFSTVLLKVTLEDVNDNPPEFIPRNYHIKVREDLPIGTVAMWLEAYDPDVGHSSQVRYSLIDNGEGYFDVDKLSGALRIVQKLDFEKKQFYNLTARAKDKGRPVSLSSTCYIQVEVVDVNENLYPPVFPFFAANGSVREDVPIGTPVMMISADDNDRGRDGEVRYSIRDGSGLGIFKIDEEKGIIKTAELLDRETTPHYWLTVYATDLGVVPLFTFIEVYIEIEDVNDNAPQTSEPVYYPEVLENTPKDVSVVQIEASDPDSSSSDRLSYKITGGNPQGFFLINQKTGLITTTSRKLDREQQAEHILEVTITDNGSVPKSTITRVIVKVLDENDNKPQFLQKFYKIKLPERIKPEREKSVKREPIFRVIAADKDEGPNAEISYSIEEGDDQGKFFIEPKTGVVSSKKLSAAGEYDILTIKAVDNGRPQKSSTTRLHIEWIVKPKASTVPWHFEEPSFSFSVMESDPVTHMVGVIAVEPVRTTLWFDIIGGNYDSRFDVDKGSGTIIVARPLDAEQKSNYNLTVEATDGTMSIRTQVYIKIIDTNDHRPEFSKPKYEVNIPEDTIPESIILQVSATDKDEKNKLIYILQSSTDPSSLKKYRLDPSTGNLFTAEKLDHEMKHQHILTVMVRDQDVPVKRNYVRVIINVEDTNDHAPWFTSTSYTGHVYESAAIDSAVLQVTALDKDKGQNAEVTYTIESGNAANSFAINPVLGTVIVAKGLDRSTRRQYELIVKATDGGVPPMSAITSVRIFVTVSDNAAPKFAVKEYYAEISEGASIGSFVILATASSQSTITYEIKDGNTDGAFNINPNSGVIIIQEALDNEELALYRLTVQATNMAGLSTNITVLIQVQDENDNMPVFTQSEYIGIISESAYVNSVVLNDKNTPLVIQATDADEGSNALLIYQIAEPSAQKYFAIDSSTGAIRAVLKLDYEETSIFHFTVQVHDSGNPQLFAEYEANVTIHVIDVNDCPPVFVQDLYEVSLLVPTYKGVKVVVVNATDADSSSNADLIYSIIDGNIGEKFSMAAKTGLISVRNVTQLRSRYELTVRASDGRFSSTTSVHVSIKESQESNLKFTQSSYSAVVKENSTDIKTIAIITTMGNEMNEPLFYHILNPDSKFKISRTSGVLATTGIPFDREEQDVYDVVVEVSEEKKSSRVAHVVVKVTVEDINDNAPIFVNLPYYAVVQVDAEVGHIIRQVTAIDKDVGKNGEVYYYLKKEHEHFQVEPSGAICLKKSFEPNLSNVEFVIIVAAKDGGEEPLSTEVEVPITVINKAMPVFEKPFYSIEIPEDIQLHTPVVYVQANSPEGPRVIYSIADGDPFNQFTINFNTGVVSVISSLDFEMHPAYKLTVRATDSLTGSHAEVFVDIVIEDVNDNPPVFTERKYTATLSEASVVGTSVVQVIATDSDSGMNKILYYQLVEDETKSSEYFHIDSTSGLILTARMLDYEHIQQYNLLVRALDSGKPQLSSDIILTVHITDLNDNPPLFNELLYQASIREPVTRGHFVMHVQASDADMSDVEKLQYSIISGNEHMNFAIDSKSGIITVANLHKQNLEAVYNLGVSVSDGVFRSSAEVRVSIVTANFHNPVFDQTSYEVELAENSDVGTLVTEVRATDEDSGTYGHISYYIVNDFARDKFSVEQKGKIFTSEKLDRENPLEKVIVISIMAKDGGGKVAFCNVNVILTDENDNVPQFRATEYMVNIGAYAPKGSSVIKIVASDADEGSNADIAYTIEADSDSVEENLQIDSISGLISTKESLVGLENHFYTFFVRAKDGGVPQQESLVPIYVRILPPEVPLPVFPEPFYTFTISEEINIGTEIDIIRAENDQQIAYTLVKGNTPESNMDQIFAIERDTGRLKTEKKLDHETTKWYQITVMAQYPFEEYEIVSSVDVRIQVKDENDNAPVFDSNPYEAFVVENLPEGTTVIQVKATDLDSGTNGQVTYSLAQSQELDHTLELFTINSETGWITTLKELDHEEQKKYNIVVVASDQGEKVQLSTTSVVDVTVSDVNDNPPRFTAEVYKGTVSEDDPPGGVIAILSTTDADTEEVNRQVTCYITGGDPLGQYAIEHIQNEWKVYVRKPLDREKKDHYLLNITATDGTLVAKAVVEVKVLDANDNSPTCEKTLYTETIAEDVPSGKLILVVLAEDADIRSNAEITYTLHGTGSEKFRLDPDTGELKTLAPLDREEQAVYNLLMKATDGGGRFCQADVVIILEDVNDNAPVFSADPYTVSVFENTANKTLLTRVQATDADTGLNRKVLYSLVDSAEDHFSIDELSGIISLEKPLDRELHASYTVIVKATDQGTLKKLSSVCTLLVSVLDINDNPPVFEHREYLATLSEDTPLGTEVLQVFAASKDVEANTEITYSIISGNEHGKFSINANTGAIFVVKSLDFETSHEYYLTVEVMDGGTPSLNDVATVNINVTDVNDNTPKFSHDVYMAVISEDAPLGQLVVTVVADDSDGPSNNQIHYSIIHGNQGNPFTIDNANGEIKVAQHLDREKISGYTLTVQASDNGVSPRFNTTSVNIDVADVNDNPPMFSQANYSVIIQENKPVGSSVLQLQVIDRDSSHNGPPFTFRIISGNEQNEFQINSHGLLISTAPLQHKVKDMHLLQVQVTDSGRPPLSSSTFIKIKIIEESVYPPAILPLEIHITTVEDEYAGGVIGKIHATDQDVYDTLAYSLASDMGNSFAVSSTDGKMIAHKLLDVGLYVLNVTVTDGRFTTAADVSVHVKQVTENQVNHSIAIQFANITPEEFIGDYWRNFQRALRNILGVRRHDIQVISLQPSEAPSDLDVLLTVNKASNYFHMPEVLFHKLNASVLGIEEMMGVRILKVIHKLCAGLDCPLKYCEEKITIDTNAMSTYSTARLSFVTPRYHRTPTCLCEGSKCHTVHKLCEGNDCSSDTECVPDAKEEKYNCLCQNAKNGQCSGGASLSFNGNSYVKYRLMENENKEEMKLSLRLRTYHPHSVVMYARGTDYSILEINNGRLQYKFDCGSGPGTVSVQSIQINDGEWHSVSLAVDGNYARLVLDRVHTAAGTAPGTLRTLNLDNFLYFGGHIRQPHTKHGRNPQVSNGFRGCLESIMLNGQELPLNSKQKVHAVMEESVEMAPGCSLVLAEGCLSTPCLNSGTCSPLPNGGYFCKCTSLFSGIHCEIAVSPCASNPCLYGGTCIPMNDDYICQCRGQYKGLRCQLGPYCKDNPCKNNGRCIDSLDGPVCECEQGYQGKRCLADIDECHENPCLNEGKCENTYGSFTCNCTHGFVGKLCDDTVVNKYVSTPWNIGLEEVIGIIVFVASIFILVLVFVVFRKKICKRKQRKDTSEKRIGATTFLQKNYFDSKINKTIYSDIPPQVPVRPISYTPSIPSDSRNNLDRNSFEGSAIPEHPEFSTFNPDSTHGHRKTVAVCSVAPNLPPPPPSNSPSDCDSIQKPSWDYDYDAKVVDLDPCLSKKPLEDSACHPFNTRGSISEVQSLSSFQSESCDDNETFAGHDLKNSRAYHWDTSDWMPNVQLPGIQEYPQYEVVEHPAPLYSDPNAIDTDYYPGGYDIESDFPPPPDDFPIHEELPPLPPEYNEFDSLQPPRDMPMAGSLNSASQNRQHFNMNQYLPHHHYSADLSEPQSAVPAGSNYRGTYPSYSLTYNDDFEPPTMDNMSMSVYTSTTASCSDVSACCEMEESEVMMSDYESGDEGHFDDVTIPPLDSQQHTEV
ncbi:protocadherin Fat 1a isoform X3 [Chiloscyllium plagiosum]|uniref:protocadherin Fat 1a isoform X3 n=1 Tax=Chiloscyllium plagiosum TaxID=36176 RepID=UPI001CB7BD90|nr:protocadherin Fat 1a isoform X3 [Chiloscyllium plagiosum]